MQTEIRFRHIDNVNELRALVDRRVHLHLSKLSDVLSRVVIRLTDENGPRGGVDKRCQVVVYGERRGVFVVESTHVDTIQAVNAALDSAARRICRAIARERMVGRLALPERLSALA